MALRKAAYVIVLLALATAGCRGDDKSDDASARTTTTRESTTTSQYIVDLVTTTTAAGASAGTTTTTKAGAKPATTTTVRIESTHGGSVNDAPRDAHSEKTDNTGTLTYSPTPTNQVNAASHPANDPLDFTISCTIAADGHGTCHLILINRVTRTAQFPAGGLTITLTMQRAGAAAEEFSHTLSNVTSLRAGEQAEVDATFDLTVAGTYTYSATTTIAWP
jgi:hypothetical protein